MVAIVRDVMKQVDKNANGGTVTEGGRQNENYSKSLIERLRQEAQGKSRAIQAGLQTVRRSTEGKRDGSTEAHRAGTEALKRFAERHQLAREHQELQRSPPKRQRWT